MGAFTLLVKMAPRRWWARPPFLPLPDRAWTAFRMETAYGSPNARPSAEDLLEFIAWARAMPFSPGRFPNRRRSAR